MNQEQFHVVYIYPDDFPKFVTKDFQSLSEIKEITVDPMVPIHTVFLLKDGSTCKLNPNNSQEMVLIKKETLENITERLLKTEKFFEEMENIRFKAKEG